MEEPVHDHEEDGDRDQAGDGLQLVGVVRELAEDRLGEEPGCDRGGKGNGRAGRDRAPQASLRAQHRCGHCREDQDGLEALAEDDHSAVRDDHGVRRAGRRLGGVGRALRGVDDAADQRGEDHRGEDPDPVALREAASLDVVAEVLVHRPGTIAAM